MDLYVKTNSAFEMFGVSPQPITAQVQFVVIPEPNFGKKLLARDGCIFAGLILTTRLILCFRFYLSILAAKVLFKFFLNS